MVPVTILNLIELFCLALELLINSQRLNLRVVCESLHTVIGKTTVKIRKKHNQSSIRSPYFFNHQIMFPSKYGGNNNCDIVPLYCAVNSLTMGVPKRAQIIYLSPSLCKRNPF